MYASVSLEWEIAAMQTLSAKRPRRLNSVCLSLEAWRALCAATESSDKGKNENHTESRNMSRKKQKSRTKGRQSERNW